MRAGAVLGAVMVCLSCSQATHEHAETRTRVALLVQLGGAVDVLRAGAVDWTRANANTALYEEDRLRTFRGAWAQLSFIGGSALKVEEESLISLGGVVTVERGAVQGELAAGMKLRTPAVEAESVPSRDIVFR
jgi:hypothetical protein